MALPVASTIRALSFAHGGKDRHPFPVPLKTYDESLNFLRTALGRAKLGGVSAGSGSDRVSGKEKLEGFRRLDRFVRASRNPTGAASRLDAVVATKTQSLLRSTAVQSSTTSPRVHQGSARSFDCAKPWARDSCQYSTSPVGTECL